MRSFRHPRWQHLDYRVKVATTLENKPPTQGTCQWTFTTPRWRCGSILLPSLNAGVHEPTGGSQMERVHQLLARSDQYIVYKCAEIARPIRDQETVGIQRRVTKSYVGLERPMLNLHTKFELNPSMPCLQMRAKLWWMGGRMDKMIPLSLLNSVGEEQKRKSN